MKILSNKKYNDLVDKQFSGIFADVNDDNLLRENGLLYGKNKKLQERINKAIKRINDWDEEKTTYIENYYFKEDLLEILKGVDKE